MFYDNVYVLSDVFYRFLLDNPDIQHAPSDPTLTPARYM
jgi:hypothetical protein